jgi:hypothetical protein
MNRANFNNLNNSLDFLHIFHTSFQILLPNKDGESYNAESLMKFGVDKRASAALFDYYILRPTFGAAPGAKSVLLERRRRRSCSAATKKFLPLLFPPLHSQKRERRRLGRFLNSSLSPPKPNTHLVGSIYVYLQMLHVVVVHIFFVTGG